MLKKIMLASLAAGAVALNAPAAMADAPTYDCGFDSLQVGAVSQTYEGAAYGFVVHAGDADATIRCYITVDGTAVSSTPTGTGVTAGPVSFTASDTSVVEMCAEATTDHGTVTTCGGSTNQPIPPDEFWDLLDAIILGLVDPAACGVLDDFPGTYGNVTVGSDGDVYVDGEPVWDCPPYQHFPPA